MPSSIPAIRSRFTKAGSNAKTIARKTPTDLKTTLDSQTAMDTRRLSDGDANPTAHSRGLEPTRRQSHALRVARHRQIRPDCAYGRPSQDFGTTRVGTERGPGYQNYDLSLSKAFTTFKGEAIKARIDAFNAFNIASYANPNTYIGGSLGSYGYITGTSSGPRKIQISAIYTF